MMGSFYTNITLRTTDTGRVVSALRIAHRVALVSAPKQGCIVVCDEATEEQDLDVLRALTSLLSRECNCAALGVMNHDDDVLLYFLADAGTVVDEYNSAPAYFDPDGDPDTPPSGGDPTIAARLFGASHHTLARILSEPGTDDSFVFAMDRHRALAEALGTPTFCVGAGFTYLTEGEYPEGADESTFSPAT